MKTGINGGFYYRGGSMLRVFRAGDRLLVLVTADRQDYYVLQKAVFS